MKYPYNLIILTLFSLFLSCRKKENVEPVQVMPVSEPVKVTTVFHDDFSDSLSDSWYLGESESNKFIMKDGFYEITNKNESGVYVWHDFGLDQGKNFSIKTDVTWKSGVTDYGFGLMFGLNDTHDCFTFLITQDGSFILYEVDNGENIIIKDWTSFGMHPYRNELEVSKEGNNMAVKINGIIAYQQQYIPLKGNKIGFGVGGMQEVAFDYLDIKQW